MMVVPVEMDTEFKQGKPEILFEGDFSRYDVSADGKSFVMVKAVQESSSPQLIVVLNWIEELKARF